MKSLFLLLSTLLIMSSLAEAKSSGEELFDAKCSACHQKNKPENISQVIAPAIEGVMRHIKRDFDNQEAIAFISDYVMNPSEDKAICQDNKIKRFGLMPSQKGNLSDAELHTIAVWMVENFSSKGKNRKGGKGNKSCKD